MSALKDYVVSQFGNPRGFVGALVGHAMAIKNRERIAWAVSLLDVEPTDCVLEIGFGPGIALQRIVARAAEGHVAGVEISSLMVNQAARRLASAIGAGHVDLRLGSVSALPFADETFDKALAINTMMFWPEPVANLLEVKRTLRPGGRLLIVQQPHGAKNDAAVQRVGTRIWDTLEAAGFVDRAQAHRQMYPVGCVAVSGRRT